MPEHHRVANAAIVAVAAAVVVATVLTSFAADPAPTCEAGKLKLAGKYGACQMGAYAKAAKAGGLPALASCDDKLEFKWQGTEAKAGAGVCPSEGDQGTIEDFVSLCTAAVDDALDGGRLPGCLGTSLTLKTGQVTCYDNGGASIPCAGTEQDGEFQKGLERSFTDNGDGTITDNDTGLVWEKLSDDASIHDENAAFPWAQTFSKIATLNSASFAGHNDWRLPNVNELNTLVDFSVHDPATYPIFNNGCVPGCTVLTCSCTLIDDYWSSTSQIRQSGDQAWTVSVGGRGDTRWEADENSFRVRAVRGGS